MSRKPNLASRQWNDSGLTRTQGEHILSQRKDTHIPRVPIPPTTVCPRCGLLGHGVDSHFDQHQFAGNKEIIRDEFGNEIGDYSND